MRAVSYSDYDAYGCPECGCDVAIVGSSYGCGTTPVTCEECHAKFVILADGVTRSAIGFGAGEENPDGRPVVEYPVRERHPRHGTPKHAYVWPDPRPEGGGEYWSSRGIGYDLSGFVKSRQAGERILAMVRKVLKKHDVKSWLDWRPNEPKWIQFKFQSEEFDLEKLDGMARANGGILTREILAACKA